MRGLASRVLGQVRLMGSVLGFNSGSCARAWIFDGSGRVLHGFGSLGASFLGLNECKVIR